MILIAVIYNVFKVYVYLFQILQTDHDIPKPNLSGDRSGGIFIRFKEIETQITSDLEFVINGLEFEIIVDQEPVKVGIDPYNKLIDRTPDNNTKSLKGGDKDSGEDNEGTAVTIKVGN